MSEWDPITESFDMERGDPDEAEPTFRDREHMLNCLLDEMLKTRRPGETAGQFAARLHPEDLRTLYWQRKIREYADANGMDPDEHAMTIEPRKSCA